MLSIVVQGDGFWVALCAALRHAPEHVQLNL
jgi:hypothetical protein